MHLFLYYCVICTPQMINKYYKVYPEKLSFNTRFTIKKYTKKNTSSPFKAKKIVCCGCNNRNSFIYFYQVIYGCGLETKERERNQNLFKHTIFIDIYISHKHVRSVIVFPEESKRYFSSYSITKTETDMKEITQKK